MVIFNDYGSSPRSRQRCVVSVLHLGDRYRSVQIGWGNMLDVLHDPRLAHDMGQIQASVIDPSGQMPFRLLFEAQVF